jgi:5-hydroxyisourate hydrolase
MSQITTHILDTSKGKPAKEVAVILYQNVNGMWEELAKGITNDDGRIPHLLQKDFNLEPGAYKMRFETKEYFDKLGIDTFYPYVEIVFGITTDEHYHIPLLLNPFGYSTYRGS